MTQKRPSQRGETGGWTSAGSARRRGGDGAANGSEKKRLYVLGYIQTRGAAIPVICPHEHFYKWAATAGNTRRAEIGAGYSCPG